MVRISHILLMTNQYKITFSVSSQAKGSDISMIHVLYTDISSADKNIYNSLYEKASPERKQRADRYLHYKDKIRCVTADALLKTALGIDEYEVIKNESGKPLVRNHADFHYNISHSGDFVVIAWGDSEVGVDIQEHDVNTNMEAIARYCFVPEEQSYVCEGDFVNLFRFYEIWTKKESWMKYTGKVLQTDLRSFSVISSVSSVQYQHRIVYDRYSLCLCTTDNKVEFVLLDVQQLL